MRIDSSGNVGIGTSLAARLDVMDDGSAATDMVQIWRNSDGTIQSSMSATGVMKANYFIGNGAGLTNLTGASPVNSALNSTQIWVGNSTNLANARTMSGDATLGNTGALTLANSGVTADTYRSVTVDAKGRVTAGTKPTTFAGYGITAETSANLAAAISNETGSGALVFANGPTFPSTVTVSGGNLTMGSAAANRIYFDDKGVEAPGANSIGEKIQLYGTAGAVGASDYALGIESNNMWLNAGGTGGFKFYRGANANYYEIRPYSGGNTYTSIYVGSTEMVRMTP